MNPTIPSGLQLQPWLPRPCPYATGKDCRVPPPQFLGPTREQELRFFPDPGHLSPGRRAPLSPGVQCSRPDLQAKPAYQKVFLKGCYQRDPVPFTGCGARLGSGFPRAICPRARCPLSSLGSWSRPQPPCPPQSEAQRKHTMQKLPPCQPPPLQSVRPGCANCPMRSCLAQAVEGLWGGETGTCSKPFLG